MLPLRDGLSLDALPLLSLDCWGLGVGFWTTSTSKSSSDARLG